MPTDDRSLVNRTPRSPANVPLFRGINHFNVLENRILNVGLGGVLKFMWGLKSATDAERLQLGYDRNGGHFTGHRARSVYAGTPREVFRLNYRHKGFGNNWPLFYLVDELVQIGEGIFLGQVLFATDHLLESYDPAAPDERYHYQNFGFFLLMQPQWRGEAQRLFPHLEVPDAAITNRIEGGPAAPDPKLTAKLSTLTLAPAGDNGKYGGNVDAALLAAVKQDLAQKETVIDSHQVVLRQPSPGAEHQVAGVRQAGDAVQRRHQPQARHRVLSRGAGVVAARRPAQGGAPNGFGLAWEAIRSFSPWTGKSFAPIDKKKLGELTEGFETGEVETFYCANTVVFRNERERFIRTLARAVDAPMEEATPEERRLDGFDAKTFFFLSKAAPSIHPENGGKPVFQFNYRWKALRNPIPDRYCIDEIVRLPTASTWGSSRTRWTGSRPGSGRRSARYKYGLLPTSC